VATLRTAEHRFYSGMALAMTAAIVLGFARTFFLRPWFPEVAAAFSPPEPFFFTVHGGSITAWLLLQAVQPFLIANGTISLHRKLGWVGAGLAIVVIAVGVLGSLMAAGRPGGFIGVTVPPLQFLAVPLADLALFAAFVALAILTRASAQTHKRFMLLSTVGLLDAGIIRWPFPDMGAPVLGTLFTRTDVLVDLFLVPLIVWDLISRGRVHWVTAAGSAAVIASQPLRLLISETSPWLRFAEWAVGLVSR
jgi:hypothetical protein